MHADADYSICEGFACQGYPVTTILRGKVIVEHGKLVGSSSDGRWVQRRFRRGLDMKPAYVRVALDPIAVVAPEPSMAGSLQ